MANRGAQPGNDNAVKGKTWAGAIRRVMNEGGREGAIELARVLIAKAKEGDMAAIKEVGDRLDGKPAQTIGSDPDQPMLVKGVVEFVKTGI